MKKTTLVVLPVVNAALLIRSDGHGDQVLGVEPSEPETFVQHAEQPHPSLKPVVEP
jgi:hypothetical protein